MLFWTKTQKSNFESLVLNFLIFYLNINEGYFLIYIYILSKLKVKYKLKENKDIYLNGNKYRKALVNSIIG